MLRQKLLPPTLLLGCLGCPPDHSCLLQISDLGWEETPGMAESQRDLTPGNAPRRTKGFQRLQVVSTRRLFSTLPGAFRNSSVETNNTGVGGQLWKWGKLTHLQSAPTLEDSCKAASLNLTWGINNHYAGRTEVNKDHPLQGCMMVSPLRELI